MNQPPSGQKAPQMKMEDPRKKIIWTVVIVFIVLLAMGAIAWYFFLGPGKSKNITTNLGDPTAKWYQFESKTFGYTIKYPTDWQYKNEGTKTSFSPKDTTDIYLEVNVINDTLASVVNDQKSKFGFIDQSNVTIDNQQWTKLNLGVRSIYLAEKNSQVYQMADFGLGFTEVVKNMVDSFKFTNPSSDNTQGTQMAFDVLAAGAISSGEKLDPQNTVFENNNDFQALWQRIYSISSQPKQVPSVDFNQNYVIAVLSSQASIGEFEMGIEKVIEKQDNIEVIVKETTPASGCPTTSVTTQPFEFIKIQKINKEVKFTINPETKNC